MPGVLLDMAISLDGFVGRADTADPGLYDWYFDPPSQSKAVIDELVETTGAIVLGRGAFGTGEDAAGWGEQPLPRQAFRSDAPAAGDAAGEQIAIEFVFVPDGVPRAIELAREAAGERYMTVGGGADIARQLLAAGLVAPRTIRAGHDRWRPTVARSSTGPPVESPGLPAPAPSAGRTAAQPRCPRPPRSRRRYVHPGQATPRTPAAPRRPTRPAGNSAGRVRAPAHRSCRRVRPPRRPV